MAKKVFDEFSEGVEEAEVSNVSGFPMSIERYLEVSGTVLDKYIKAYLESIHRGVLKTADEWAEEIKTNK